METINGLRACTMIHYETLWTAEIERCVPSRNISDMSAGKEEKYPSKAGEHAVKLVPA